MARATATRCCWPLGELGRPMREAVSQREDVDDLVVPLLVGLLSRQLERQQDVVLRIERGQQVERLEDEADVSRDVRA